MAGSAPKPHPEHSAPAAAGAASARELFSGFPYGLFTVDGGSRVITMNDACRELLVRQPMPVSRPVTCCELVCEWTADEGVAGCLGERARALGRPLPEVRIDLAAGGPRSAAWVTVAPLNREGHTVFHLRPGHARDRRRRSRAQGPAAPPLRVFVLGQTRIETEIADSSDREWIDQRPGELLKYLVCAGAKPVSANEIITALWPAGSNTGTGAVRYIVHALRNQLEPARESGSPSSFIGSDPAGYHLILEHVWVDASEFEQLVNGGLTALAAGKQAVALDQLERAIALYRGDLLEDEPYAEWAFHERERLKELCGRALRATTELRLAASPADEETVAYSRRLADLELYDTDAQRRHLEICIRHGRRSEAVRRYELYQRRMLREFGQEPPFTLADLDRA